jgi:chromosome segregation ATPase
MSDIDNRLEKLGEEIKSIKKEVDMFKMFKKLFAKDDNKIDELKQENKACKKALKEAKEKLEEQKQLNSKLSKELQTLQNQNQTLHHKKDRYQQFL